MENLKQRTDKGTDTAEAGDEVRPVCPIYRADCPGIAGYTEEDRIEYFNEVCSTEGCWDCSTYLKSLKPAVPRTGQRK